MKIEIVESCVTERSFRPKEVPSDRIDIIPFCNANLPEDMEIFERWCDHFKKQDCPFIVQFVWWHHHSDMNPSKGFRLLKKREAGGRISRTAEGRKNNGIKD